MYRILSLLVFILLTEHTWALADDSQKKMNIIADSWVFNYKTGIDQYEGNVKIDQGSSHLTADRVITEKNKRHKIISAVAYGLTRFAEFNTLPKLGDKILHAQAKTITFYPNTSIVVLEENVTVSQGDNRLYGPLIVYNMKDQIVSAPVSKNGRATVVINPNEFK